MAGGAGPGNDPALSLVYQGRFDSQFVAVPLSASVLVTVPPSRVHSTADPAMPPPASGVASAFTRD